jgi:hypothetical protein
MDWLFGPSKPNAQKFTEDNKRLTGINKKLMIENTDLKISLEQSFQLTNDLQVKINELKAKLERSQERKSDSEKKTDSEKSKEECTCTICLERITELYALVPCGHTNLCTECYNKNNIYQCPLCREQIDMRIKIFT